MTTFRRQSHCYSHHTHSEMVCEVEHDIHTVSMLIWGDEFLVGREWLSLETRLDPNTHPCSAIGLLEP